MHFIETLFHLSPDGGSGMTELMFFVVPVTVCALLGVHRYKRSRSAPPSHARDSGVIQP